MEYFYHESRTKLLVVLDCETFSKYHFLNRHFVVHDNEKDVEMGGPKSRHFRFYLHENTSFTEARASQKAPQMIPKSSQNRVGILIGLALCFSIFLAPKMEPTTPDNSNITHIKQRFPQIVPFPFAHRFGTEKSPKTIPKSLQNQSKKRPENTSKLDPTFHRFRLRNDPPK